MATTVQMNPMSDTPHAANDKSAPPSASGDTFIIKRVHVYAATASLGLALLLSIVAIGVAASAGGGGGGTSDVTSANLAASAVTAPAIAAGAVTAGALSAEAVTQAALATGAVTASKLAANAVTSNAIAAGAVASTALDTGAVTSTAIAADAVTSAAIADNAVAESAINVGAVTAAKLSASAVTVDKIASDAVTAAKLASGAVNFGAVGTGVVPVSTTGWRTDATINVPAASGGVTKYMASSTGPGGFPMFLYSYLGTNTGQAAGLVLAQCTGGTCTWQNLYSEVSGSKWAVNTLATSTSSGFGKLRFGMTSSSDVGIVFYQGTSVKFRTCSLPCTTLPSPYTLMTVSGSSTYVYLDAAFTSSATGIVVSSGDATSGTVTYIYDKNSYSTKTTTIATGGKYDGQPAITWRSDVVPSYPIIAYTETTGGTNTVVKLIICTGSAEYCCAGSGCALPTAVTLSTESGIGMKTAWLTLRLDAFGFPLAGYVRGDFSNANIMAVSCGSMTCSSPTKTFLTNNYAAARSYTTRGFDMGVSPADGTPFFTFVDTNSKIWLARCTDGKCATADAVSASMVGSISASGAGVSLAFTPSGLPFIANGDGYPAAVEVIACPNVQCSEQPQPW